MKPAVGDLREISHFMSTCLDGLTNAAKESSKSPSKSAPLSELPTVPTKLKLTPAVIAKETVEPSPPVTPSTSTSSTNSQSTSQKAKSGHSSSKTKSSSKSSSSSSSSSNSSATRSHSSNSPSSRSRHTASSSKERPPSSTSWSKSSSKSPSPLKLSGSQGSYTLSIPSSDTGMDESVESLLATKANSDGSKTLIQIFATSVGTDKPKNDSVEFEQLKFYADSSEKKSKLVLESETSPLSSVGPKAPEASNTEESAFKVPNKTKPVASSTSLSSSSSTGDSSSKKSKSSSSKPSDSPGKSGNRGSQLTASSPRIASSTVPSPTVTVIDKPTGDGILLTEPKPKPKKKKKKKDKDEPRKVIPLKDRAFHPDQHCGVCLPEEAHPCTRSLTCKTHSIALRRAVAGRSHSFDTLLAAHKKARDEEKTAKSKDQGEEIVRIAFLNCVFKYIIRIIGNHRYLSF
jgi:hypothetical protein